MRNGHHRDLCERDRYGGTSSDLVASFNLVELRSYGILRLAFGVLKVFLMNDKIGPVCLCSLLA